MRSLIFAVLATSSIWLSPLAAQEVKPEAGEANSRIGSQTESSVNSSKLNQDKSLIFDHEREEIKQQKEEELRNQDQQRAPDPPPRKALPLPAKN